MRDALEAFAGLRLAAGAENERLAGRFGLTSTSAPLAGLNFIHQQATLASEQLGFYIGWSEDPANRPRDVARREVEDNQRAISIGKSALVMSLSGIEAAAKLAIAEHSRVLPARSGRQYLIGILRQSAHAGLLSPDVERGWKAVIDLRNSFVHNNSVPEVSCRVALPGGPTISLTRGEMLHGSVRLLPEVLFWTTTAFSSWSEAFLERARVA